MTGARYEAVMTPADPAQADAIRDALLRAGIDARLIFDDNAPHAGARLELRVPPAQARAARLIIEQGNWPRIA